jgi:hypothetical protein
MKISTQSAAMIALAAVLAAGSSAMGGVLWGVSGDGSGSPRLFTINTGTGAMTLQMSLGNGGDGEGIGYNPNDGLIYHTSGISSGNQFFETVNPGTLTVGANLAAGGTYGPAAVQEITSIEWYQPLGVFLVSDRSSSLFHVTTAGAFTNVGSTPYMRGLSVVGTQVFGINPSSFASDLFEVNPATGAIINTLPLTLDGDPGSGQGLATDPDTGIVYAVMRDPAGNDTRILATLDVTTGAATSIGILDERIAGITFVPAPGAAALLGLGGLMAMRRRR